MPILIASLGGAAVLAIVLLLLLRPVIRRARERAAHRLASCEAEGVVARSGRGWMTLVLRNYRGHGRIAGVELIKQRGELLVTKAGVHVLGLQLRNGLGVIDLGPADLAKWRAWHEDGLVHLATSSPPNATGELELRAHAGPELLAALQQHGVILDESR
jgi:hypothetical protein